MKHRFLAWTVAGALLFAPLTSAALPVSFAQDGGNPDAKVTSKAFGTAEGQNLKEHGFIEGGTGGVLMETEQLTREQLAILTAQLMGEKQKAQQFQVASGYSDEKEFPAWSRSYISYNKARGWMRGSGGKFDNKGLVSAEELAIVLLRALGYPEAKWGENVDALARVGIDFKKLGVMSEMAKPVEHKVTRGQSFVAMWEAVTKSVMKSGECLGVKLGKIDTPLDQLLIRSVKVVSSKVFLVEFNRETGVVDAEDLKVFAGTPQKIAKVERVDELTFRVEMLNYLPRNTKVTVKGEHLYAKNIPTPFSVAYNFDSKDKVKPELVSISKAGELRLVLAFSEPLGEKSGNVKVEKDGQEIASHYSIKGSEIHVTLHSALGVGDKLTIIVERFVDTEGNEMKYGKQEFRVAQGED